MRKTTKRPGISRLSKKARPALPRVQTTKKQRNTMRLKQADVERRRKVALDYFTKNPNATGEAFNKALSDGSLTGNKEPALNIKRVYDYRKEARAALAAGEKPASIPAAEFKSARRFGAEVPVAGPTLTVVAQQHIRGLISEFRNLPGDVMDITVTRQGTVNVGRLARREDTVALG